MTLSEIREYVARSVANKAFHGHLVKLGNHRGVIEHLLECSTGRIVFLERFVRFVAESRSTPGAAAFSTPEEIRRLAQEILKGIEA